MQSLPKSGLAKYADVLKLKMGKSDVWKPDKKSFLQENQKWVNSKTLEELPLISATVACGQLQQSGAYPNNEDFNEVYLVTFPTWRTTRRCRAAEVVAGTASVEVAADAGQEISPAEVAAGAPSVEVAADAYPAEKSRPRGRWRAK